MTRTNTATNTADIGNITSFSVAPQNVVRFATSGLDVNLDYRLDVGSIDRFNRRVIGNYMTKLNFLGTPSANVTNSRGEAFASKYTVNTNLTWQLGNVTVNYGLSWFDKTLRYSNQVTQGNPDIVAPQYLYLRELWQHDIYLSVDATDRFQFFGGVNNVFGQKPEIATSTYPVSALGRYIFVGARVKLPTL